MNYLQHGNHNASMTALLLDLIQRVASSTLILLNHCIKYDIDQRSSNLVSHIIHNYNLHASISTGWNNIYHNFVKILILTDGSLLKVLCVDWVS